MCGAGSSPSFSSLQLVDEALARLIEVGVHRGRLPPRVAAHPRDFELHVHFVRGHEQVRELLVELLLDFRHVGSGGRLHGRRGILRRGRSVGGAGR